MQPIVLDKPYRFFPPYPGKFWARLVRLYVPIWLKRSWGIERIEIRGADHLRQSLAAKHGILLAATHSRPCDPMVIGMLSREVDRLFYCMASWHLFMLSRWKGWLLQKTGIFSVYREGVDREAIKMAVRILVEAKRPLLLFPEGIVTYTNDRLGTLQEGTAFIARSAAKQRAKLDPPGQVVIHPVAIKHYFEGDLQAAVSQVLDDIETRLTWRPRRERPLLERICQVGDALLALKETEYLGKPQSGSIDHRLTALMEHLLQPLEKEWLSGPRQPSAIERVKQLRTVILADMAAGKVSEAERARRWRQLADLYLVQQLSNYPPDYLNDQSPPDRLLETVERLEEDLTDVARIHRPMRAVIQVGAAISIRPGRDRGGSSDPLMRQLAEQLQGMLTDLGKEANRKIHP